MHQSATPASERTEFALVKHTMEVLPLYLGRRAHAWKVRREVSVGSAIADVLILVGQRRSCLQVPAPLSAAESVVLASLRRIGPTAVERLQQLCGLNMDRLVGDVLSRLISWQVVLNGENGLLTLAHRWFSNTRILAIEAKLKDWKEAIRQATSYTQYADESYVLLPEKQAARAREFIKHSDGVGIGVLTIRDGQLTTQLRAKRYSNHDWRREYAYSRLAAANGG